MKTTLVLAAVGLTLATASSQAAITLNDGGTTVLEVGVRDRTGNPTITNTMHNLFPASLPYDENQIATQGDSQSQATYHLGQDGVTITAAGFRAGSLDSRANVQPVIYFSVSVDTPYKIMGSLSVEDPGTTGKGVGLTATLTDLTTSEILYHSDQGSFGVVDQAFTLGETAGNTINELSGAPTGVLLAGHQYRLFYGTSIYASNAGDPASFVASFDFEAHYLTIQMYAGLTINGVPGATYQIQGTTNLNSPTNWTTLTNLTLPSSPYLFFDASSAGQPMKFYRALLTD